MVSTFSLVDYYRSSCLATYISDDETAITNELLHDASSYTRILEEELISSNSSKKFVALNPSPEPARNSFKSIMTSGVSFMGQFEAQRNFFIESSDETKVQSSAEHYALLVTVEAARAANMNLGTFYITLPQNF
jgi:hypothetical protein